MERKHKIAVNPGLRQGSGRWLLLLGSERRCQESCCLGNPTQSKIIKSYQHFQELRTFPSSLSSCWESSKEGDCITMPGPRITCSCNPIPCPSYVLRSPSWHRRVPNWFRGIWDCLWSNPFALLYCWHPLPHSPSGVAEETLLFNPCSFQSDLLLQQQGCVSAHCPGTRRELCAARLRADRAAQRMAHS